MQRLLKSVIANQAQPYKLDELNKIAAHCTEREDAAKRLNERCRKLLLQYY